VALAHDEPVALRRIRPPRIHPQSSEVKRDQNVGGGEIPTRMAQPGAVHHAQTSTPNLAGQIAQERGNGRYYKPCRIFIHLSRFMHFTS
jgi:hypothetical protein